jgi:hypothetical protein
MRAPVIHFYPPCQPQASTNVFLRAHLVSIDNIELAVRRQFGSSAEVSQVRATGRLGRSQTKARLATKDTGKPGISLLLGSEDSDRRSSNGGATRQSG